MIAILPPCLLASSDGRIFRHALGTLKAEKDADAMRHGG